MEKIKTLKGIANELSLSVTTVSLVLNGLGEKYRVKKVTRDRVLNYVKAEKFVLDQRAKSLRTNQSRIISLLICKMPDEQSFSIIKCLEEITFQEGYRLVLHFITDLDKANSILAAMHDRQVDGSVIFTNKQEPIYGLAKSLSNEIPILLFEMRKPGEIQGYICGSEFQCATNCQTSIHMVGLFRKLKDEIERSNGVPIHC